MHGAGAASLLRGTLLAGPFLQKSRLVCFDPETTERLNKVWDQGGPGPGRIVQSHSSCSVDQRTGGGEEDGSGDLEEALGGVRPEMMKACTTALTVQTDVEKWTAPGGLMGGGQQDLTINPVLGTR